MMKFLFATLMVFLLTITLTDSVYAIRINEIEANPEGEDSGNEWVELYSDAEINLDGYFLENGDGGIYNLSGNFRGFLVIVFPGQWLDNKDEIVYLKLDNNIIDSSDNFTDNKKEKTYSFCNNKWIFSSSSKNEENICDSANNQNTNINSQTNQNTQNSNQNVNANKKKNQKDKGEVNIAVNKQGDDVYVNPLVDSENNQKPEKIVLNSKQNKESNIEGEITKTYKTRVAVIYFFIGLCVLLVVLIALRRL